MSKKRNELEELVRRQLELLGEDPARDGLQKTPERVARSMEFLTKGYSQTPKSILNNALFDVKSDEMVIVKDIDFYSLCEHHMLPFFGKCHVAYLPGKKVVGLVEAAEVGGCVRAAVAGAGTVDARNCEGT